MLNTLQTPHTRSILIIEDDPVHRLLMASELQHWYALDFAADSESALRHLQGEQFPRYDLVIVDLRLPARVGGSDKTEEGFKILKTLHKGGKGTPIALVVSGNLIDRIRKQVEGLGVKRVFEKPLSLRELHEYIDSLLGGVETDRTPSG